MATNARSRAVGIFTDHYEAQRTIGALQCAGFSGYQIHCIERDGAITQGNTSKDDLVKMGVPEEDADDYQNQVDTSRTIVVVGTPDRYEQAMGILRENGGSVIQTPRRCLNFQ